MPKQMMRRPQWALLCLLSFGLRSKPSEKEQTRRGGWGTSLSSAPNAYTTEGQLAMGWAFIDGCSHAAPPASSSLCGGFA